MCLRHILYKYRAFAQHCSRSFVPFLSNPYPPSLSAVCCTMNPEEKFMAFDNVLIIISVSFLPCARFDKSIAKCDLLSSSQILYSFYTARRMVWFSEFIGVTSLWEVCCNTYTCSLYSLILNLWKLSALRPRFSKVSMGFRHPVPIKIKMGTGQLNLLDSF